MTISYKVFITKELLAVDLRVVRISRIFHSFVTFREPYRLQHLTFLQEIVIGALAPLLRLSYGRVQLCRIFTMLQTVLAKSKKL